MRVYGKGREQTRAGARQFDFYGVEMTRECTARGRTDSGRGTAARFLRYGSDMRVHLGFFPSVPSTQNAGVPWIACPHTVK